MRIKLSLRSVENNSRIPINYQYPLSAAIYKILSHGSAEYADWLHNKGYLSGDGKPRKLFNFSKLHIPGVKRIDSTLLIPGNRNCQVCISSPMLEDFIQHFVIGLFENQKIEIGGRNTITRFAIESVETVALPEFKPHQKFRCLSPVVISGKHLYDERLQEYYLRADDPDLSNAIKKNLTKKYELIFQKSIDDDNFEFVLDRDYITRRGGIHKISKLITIKENIKNEATKIKCFESPFTLSAKRELMNIAWECGIGQRNSLGFGMVDLVTD